MKLLVLTKRIDALLNVLKIDKLKILECSLEELDDLLAPMPKYDRKVLYAINGTLTKGSSKATNLLIKYKEAGIEDENSMLRDYLGETCTSRYSNFNNYEEFITYVSEHNLVNILTDKLKKLQVVIVEDDLLYYGLFVNSSNFMAVTTSLQVYNEVVTAGYTPVKLIKQLFKYI